MKTLVIIGAGFSGTVSAIEFLRSAPQDSRLIIINRSGTVARGLAYGTSSSRHLLNVPAGNMSAQVDNPNSFLEYCQACLPGTTSGSFVSRKLYGDYLASLLDSAEEEVKNRINIQRITAEVKTLKPYDQGSRIELISGKTIFADHVILAFGHFPPRTPAALECILQTTQYIENPWSDSITVGSAKDTSILLLGSGLTALDVISSLGPLTLGNGKIYLLSRRGLLPLPHRTGKSSFLPPSSLQEELLSVAPTALSYLRVVKDHVKAGAASGLNWRDIVAALRPITSLLWKRLPVHEQSRFLRHLQPYWDVHRHRVAPQTYELFEQALTLEKIVPFAGRIKAVESASGKTLVTIEQRGNLGLKKIEVNLIINCTGPNSNPGLIDEPLICQLIADGLIAVDPLGLGLRVDDNLAVETRDTIPSDWLSYVGPMLKANYWEATAVPELRLYASALGRKIAGKFSAA